MKEEFFIDLAWREREAFEAAAHQADYEESLDLSLDDDFEHTEADDADLEI